MAISPTHNLLYLHITERRFGVVQLDVGTFVLRIKEERRHGPLGLVGVLHTT